MVMVAPSATSSGGRWFVGSLAQTFPQNGPRSALDRRDQLSAGDHGAELERAVRAELDRPQLLDAVEVDKQLRRGDARLHHVDEGLPACERPRVRVRSEQPDRLLDRPWSSVLDLPKQHGGLINDGRDYLQAGASAGGSQDEHAAPTGGTSVLRA